MKHNVQNPVSVSANAGRLVAFIRFDEEVPVDSCSDRNPEKSYLTESTFIEDYTLEHSVPGNRANSVDTIGRFLIKRRALPPKVNPH
jgi:hypothetical protein